jgi:PTS system mannitol-specific IIC component
MGAIAATDVPIFIGAMVLGPLGGWTLRQIDERTTRVPSALQMLVANFSAAICGALLAVIALLAVGPAVQVATRALGSAAQALASAALLPVVALVIEPGKVLFLNNAINHGILGPLGAAQAHSAGHSIFFLLESNPGPGLGLLAAVWLCGGLAARRSAPGAMVIHFLGGIHEIYFPYVLMQPLTILALIAGGLAANFVFVATGAGLVATPSPGSIFAQLAMAPRGGALPVILGIAAGACCSFVAAVPLVRMSRAGESASDLAAARTRSAELKDRSEEPAARPSIVFACDAGMGSSVIGASILRRKLREAGVEATVAHAAIAELPADAALVVVHASLAERARAAAPRAVVYVVDEFIQSPVYDTMIDALQPGRASKASA